MLVVAIPRTTTTDARWTGRPSGRALGVWCVAVFSISATPPPRSHPASTTDIATQRNAHPKLHTVAAYYPDDPGDEDRERATQLVDALARLYPCSYCREDFQREVAESPPR